MDNEIAAIQETSKMTNQSEKSKLSGLGARLKKARESMHLTQKEAAARLYLNPKIVEIIENEAFFDGPPMTFMRGYLRSYARLLNFPESEIKTAIDELELNTTPTALATPALQASPVYRGDRYIRWITYLIVLTLISLVVLWWSSHSKYVIADVPATNPSVNPAPAVTSTTTTTTSETAAPIVSTEPAKTVPEALPSVKTEPTAATIPTAAAPPIAQPSAATEKTTSPQAIPAASPLTAPATQVPLSMIAPNSSPPAITTPVVPGGENPANATLNNEASAEKPAATQHKKRQHKRHQYRPIENMDIPEPD